MLQSEYLCQKNGSMDIAIIGYGKMGKAIEELAIRRGHTILCRISSENLQEFHPKVLQWADVAIEFSTPDSAVGNIEACLDAGVPVVCGTTGWLSRIAEIEKLVQQKNGAFLYASNFSIGVNLFFELNRNLARMMQRYDMYDVDITETHHTQKLDKPSGTAISLANDIISELHRKKKWSIAPNIEPNSEEIKITSIRQDPAPGMHEVRYMSEIDEIRLVHEAHSRKGFASGALLAAEWIQGKKGIFGMKDVLQIESLSASIDLRNQL